MNAQPAKNKRQPASQKPEESEAERQLPAFLEGKPESVQLMFLAWLVILVLEVLHQIFNVVITLFNRETLFASFRKQFADRAETEEAREILTQFAGYISIGFNVLLSLGIVILLAVMLRLFIKKSKHAATGRRMLFIFSIYFSLRAVVVFMASPAGSNAPDFWHLSDGIVQILGGVAAVMALIFSLRQETLDYTGELEELRKMEQEQKERREEKHKAKEQKKSQEKEKSESKKTDSEDSENSATNSEKERVQR